MVILAAGMGSRFGGMKQIEPIGPNGEIIIDFSCFDAKRAGFDRAVIVIRKENEEAFREAVGNRISKRFPVEYAYQTVPPYREKPFGTAEAVLCCKDVVKEPFGVINADDFYGRKSFELLHEHLISSQEMCNVGFLLGQTLTENGSVARAICSVRNGYLTAIEEKTEITKNSGEPLASICSMNMWGLTPDFFGKAEKIFDDFLARTPHPEKDECYLPNVVEQLIQSGEKVQVLLSPERWFGVTYKKDAPKVRDSMIRLIQQGEYNGI